MIDKAVVGNRISTFRKELGYSQTTLAEKLNVTTQAVSKWETGLALPDIEVLLNISWICKVSIHTILDGDNFVNTQNGVDRGLTYISKYLLCPQCHDALILHLPKKQGMLSFSCKAGHTYEFADGVVHFGSREMEGELWSLWLRNYEHYLEVQRHQGNPRYWTGNPHFREIMWQNIEKIRPQTILDMACGTGSGINYIIERINWPVTIIMADLSHRILKWNRIFYSDEWKNPYVDMVYFACDCSNLPLENNSIDLVFSNAGFESMQQKMMAGFAEAFRVLKPKGHAVYNISTVDDHKSANTKKWIDVYSTLNSSNNTDVEKLNDINQWLLECKNIGFSENKVVKVYGELPAPLVDVFPFENEVLQWMAKHVVVSQK